MFKVELDRLLVPIVYRSNSTLNTVTHPITNTYIIHILKYTSDYFKYRTTSASIAGKTRPKLLQTQTPPEQFLDVKKGVAINAENFNVGFGTFQNSVRADLVPLTKNKTKVQFKEFRVGSPLFSYKPEPGTFQGELSVTYLDDEMRISRGDQGNVFVLLRESTQRTNANRIWQAWKQRW